MAKTLLVISSLPEDLAFATEVANSAQMDLRHAENPKMGAQILAKEDIQTVLVDASSEQHFLTFEAAVQETVGLFSDRVSANTIHFVSSQDLDSAKYLAQSPLFGHFIIRNYGDIKISGSHYGRIVKATLKERSFGLAQFLKPETKIQVIQFSTTAQKQPALDAIRSFLLSAKFQNRTASIIANAVDELLMNAMFDAPIDELGKQIYASTSRSTIMDLKDKNSVELHIGFDGQYLAISAIDLFGSLDKGKVLSHIFKMYQTEEYKVKTAVAGAGLGLATISRMGGSFLFSSESRLKTEVTVFFQRTPSFREFKDQFRFISTQFYF